MKKKRISLVMALALVLTCVIGGTIAWLTDKTEDVENTFTVGNIDITLKETTGEKYKMIPGNTIDKDPTVTVEAGSEDCWLFVKVVESDNLDTFIEYTIAEEWTALDGHAGVYYREVATTESDKVFKVLAGDKVTVNNTVTKNHMDSLTEATEPTLKFTAYAIQKYKFDTAEAAWTELNK